MSHKSPQAKWISIHTWYLSWIWIQGKYKNVTLCIRVQLYRFLFSAEKPQYPVTDNNEKKNPCQAICKHFVSNPSLHREPKAIRGKREREKSTKNLWPSFEYVFIRERNQYVTTKSKNKYVMYVWFRIVWFYSFFVFSSSLKFLLGSIL